MNKALITRISGQDGSDLSELLLNTDALSKMRGFQEEMVWDERTPDGEPRRMLDTTKAEKYLGFKAKMNLEGRLRKITDRYRRHKKKNA
jgi:GDP-L-fucose synthase